MPVVQHDEKDLAEYWGQLGCTECGCQERKDLLEDHGLSVSCADKPWGDIPHNSGFIDSVDVRATVDQGTVDHGIGLSPSMRGEFISEMEGYRNLGHREAPDDPDPDDIEYYAMRVSRMPARRSRSQSRTITEVRRTNR